MSEVAKAKHEKSHKQKIKATIKVLYDGWQSLPDPKQRYRGNAAFAADMMDKYHDPNDKKGTPQNQSVIEKWCRKWEKEQNNTDPA